MGTSDIEKGAGVPQQPSATHPQTQDNFLPTYEQHLNAELLTFASQPQAQHIQPFDRIQEPKKKTLRRKACWTAASSLLFLLVSALTGWAIFLYRSTHDIAPEESGNKVDIPSSEKISITKTSLQTNTPPRSVTTITLPPTTVFFTVPAVENTTTVIYTTTFAPAESTTTFEPPAVTTTSQHIVFVTSTSLVSFTPSASEEASLISFSSEVSSTTSTTGTTIPSPSTTETTPPPPPSTTETTPPPPSTTVTPTTSEEESPAALPTETGRGFGRCGIPGEACE